MPGLTKYQRGQTERVTRGAITGAPYNPRKIGKVAAARLRKSVREHGLISAQIVVNRSTMQLVQGHQRLAQLDALEQSAEYELDVTMLELTDEQERRLNVALNNPSLQGEYDLPKLAELVSADVDHVASFGFDAIDVAAIWPDDARFGVLFAEPEQPSPAHADLAEIEKIKDAKRDGRAKMKAGESEDYYVTVVASSGDEIERLLEALGADSESRYLSASAIMDALGL